MTVQTPAGPEGGSLWAMPADVVRQKYKESRALGIFGALGVLMAVLSAVRLWTGYWYWGPVLGKSDVGELVCGYITAVVLVLSLILPVAMWWRPRWGYWYGLVMCVIYLSILSVVGGIVAIYGIFALRGAKIWFISNRRTHRNIRRAYRMRKKEGRYRKGKKKGSRAY